ncbi:MAG: hypothetical protein IPQ23_06940 [Cytophagaceae bacterium]|nr:hypothetical protein [Cytophagaceae bacterium]
MRYISSISIQNATSRLAGVKAIATDLDLGNGLNIESYQAAIKEVDDLINSYNTQLSSMGEVRNRIREKEKALKDLNERILIGVGARYGKDSNQYQMAGGTKKSMRKRRRKVAVPANTEA